jgi:hypothetical protein
MPLHVIAEWRWLVAALQDRVMQVGRVCFAGIEGNDDALVAKIDFHIANAVDPHERRPQFSDAFIAIFAFSRDFYLFQNGMIGAFGIKRIARVGVLWSGWVHHLSNAIRPHSGRLAALEPLRSAKRVTPCANIATVRNLTSATSLRERRLQESRLACDRLQSAPDIFRCHPERSEGSRTRSRRFLVVLGGSITRFGIPSVAAATLGMTRSLPLA